MSTDGSIVDEVRRRRHAISERYGHDLRAYGRYLKELALKYKSRVVSQVTVVPPKDRPPAP